MCPRNNSNAAFDDSRALTLIKCVLLFKMMLCGRLGGACGGGGSTVQSKNHFRTISCQEYVQGEGWTMAPGKTRQKVVRNAKQNKKAAFMSVKVDETDGRWLHARVSASLEHMACI